MMIDLPPGHPVATAHYDKYRAEIERVYPGREFLGMELAQSYWRAWLGPKEDPVAVNWIVAT